MSKDTQASKIQVTANISYLRLPQTSGSIRSLNWCSFKLARLLLQSESLCFIIVSVEEPHYHWTGVTPLHHLVRCESEAQSEGSRLLTQSLTLQVGGLWLYPVLMRAAQLGILLPKSIKRANKSRAVTQRSQQAGGGCTLRTTGPRWWTLSGIRERSPWEERECLWEPGRKIEDVRIWNMFNSQSLYTNVQDLFFLQRTHRATFTCLHTVCVLNKHTMRLSSGLRPSEEHLKANYVTTPHEVCHNLKLLQMLLLLPVSAGCTATILRGLTYPKILCTFEKEERKRENGDIAWRRSSLSRAWAAEIVT